MWKHELELAERKREAQLSCHHTAVYYPQSEFPKLRCSECNVELDSDFNPIISGAEWGKADVKKPV